MEAEAQAASGHPEGEYAIVEVLGHRTIIGRIAEVERFGTKFLAVEPLWQDAFLPEVLIGGSSIYQLTRCSAETAFKQQPKAHYQLPPSVAVTVPKPPAPALPSFVEDEDEDQRRSSADAGRYGDGYLHDGSIQP